MDIEVVPTAGVLHFSDLYDGCGAVVPQGPMLRGIVDVEIVDSTIIVLGGTDSGMVSLYTMDGEYLYSFLQAGRGPEEMTDVRTMAYNRFTGLLDVLGYFGAVYSFDLSSGRLVKSFTLNDCEIMYAADLLPVDADRYLFYKEMSYVDGPEYEVYLFNSSTEEVEGRWLPLDKDFAEAASFGQSNNLYEYDGHFYFYSAFLDGVYEYASDTMTAVLRFADNGYNFTQRMKDASYPDLFAFGDACAASGRIWGHVSMYRIGDRTISQYRHGKEDFYWLVMDLEQGTGISYDMLEDDMLWGVTSGVVDSPYMLLASDERFAVYTAAPYDILDLAEECPTDDPEIMAARDRLAQLPYESNDLILLMSVRQ